MLRELYPGAVTQFLEFFDKEFLPASISPEPSLLSQY